MNRSSYTYPDGSKYEGDFIDGKRHGQGTWMRPDGTRYEGEWKNDKPDGRGTLSYPNGEKRTGEWKAGKFIGQESSYVEKPRKMEANKVNDTNEKHYFLIGFLISLFGGIYGLDRFYKGQVALGLLKLLTVGGFFIWFLVDLILWSIKLGNAYHPGMDEY